jgi:hypothetical protein
MAVEYERRGEAFKAIHSALSSIATPPSGKKVTKMEFSWNLDSSIHTIQFYDGAELLFTLTFSWDGSGNLQNVERS